jgi:hypothetical protein
MPHRLVGEAAFAVTHGKPTSLRPVGQMESGMVAEECRPGGSGVGEAVFGAGL